MDPVLNGWERLFILLSGLGGLALLIMAVAYYPRVPADGAYEVYTCALTDSRITPRDARVFLAESKIPEERLYSWASPDFLTDSCRNDLAEIRDGNRHWHDFVSWAKVSVATAAAYLAFLFCVGLLGRALGWVWRGFFPRKHIA